MSKLCSSKSTSDRVINKWFACNGLGSNLAVISRVHSSVCCLYVYSYAASPNKDRETTQRSKHQTESVSVLVLTYEQGHDSIGRASSSQCCTSSLLAGLAAASSASDSNLTLLSDIAHTVTRPFSPLSCHSKVLFVCEVKQQQQLQCS
jgi:hypothetical protein